jgi:hypothetical protein
VYTLNSGRCFHGDRSFGRPSRDGVRIEIDAGGFRFAVILNRRRLPAVLLTARRLPAVLLTARRLPAVFLICGGIGDPGGGE